MTLDLPATRARIAAHWRTGDAEFVAYAREEIPALLAEVENLRHTVDYDLQYQRALEAKLARVEALADLETSHGEAITRCGHVANRIREALDGGDDK